MTDGSNILGIPGMTPGGVALWIMLLGAVVGVVGKWVIGMPDRHRAFNEKITVESRATDGVIEQLRKELTRMDARIEKLEERVNELEHENHEIMKQRDTANAELARLQAVNLGQGQNRQDAAIIIAAERLKDKG